jgi:hypothetical protein
VGPHSLTQLRVGCMSMQCAVDHESEESQVLQHGCSMASRETDQHTIHTAFEEANVSKRLRGWGPALPASKLIS